MRQTIAILILCVICAGCERGFVAPNLPRYDSKYYTIYTDLDRSAVDETKIRLTKMAEVYADRTRGFSGSIHGKLPFVLYRTTDEYLDAGGAPGSAGVFTGRALIAVAGPKLSTRTWHVVQHEGFHQFAAAVISQDLPVWVNEGLAEYFGEGLFTGDDLLTGVIPEWRRARVVRRMQAGQFEPFDRFMNLTLAEWNADISTVNYDQAWSMVQFLAHGDDGKYQPAFVKFMSAIAHRKNPASAWSSDFVDTQQIESRWREYWLALPPNPTENIYRKATVATLTSFLARAFASGQDFSSMPEFADAAAKNQLEIKADDFLPRSLLASAMQDVGKYLAAGDEFSIEHNAGTQAGGEHAAGEQADQAPRIVLRTKSGDKFTGTFVIRDGRVIRVAVERS